MKSGVKLAYCDTAIALSKPRKTAIVQFGLDQRRAMTAWRELRKYYNKYMSYSAHGLGSGIFSEI
jgi:hypothetical protein